MYMHVSKDNKDEFQSILTMHRKNDNLYNLGYKYVPFHSSSKTCGINNYQFI